MLTFTIVVVVGVILGRGGGMQGKVLDNKCVLAQASVVLRCIMRDLSTI